MPGVLVPPQPRTSQPLSFTQAAQGGVAGPLQYGTPTPGNYDAGIPVHAGRDVLAPQGNPVFALVSGVLTALPLAARPGTTPPREIAIQTSSGADLIYEHITPTVPAGTTVQVGQQIGTIAPAGNYTDPYGSFQSDAPHVHLQAVLPGQIGTWWKFSSTEDPSMLIGSNGSGSIQPTRTSAPTKTGAGSAQQPSGGGGNQGGTGSDFWSGFLNGALAPFGVNMSNNPTGASAFGANLGNTVVDLSKAVDTIAKMLPILLLLLVVAIALGHLRGTHVSIGGG